MVSWLNSSKMFEKRSKAFAARSFLLGAVCPWLTLAMNDCFFLWKSPAAEVFGLWKVDFEMLCLRLSSTEPSDWLASFLGFLLMILPIKGSMYENQSSENSSISGHRSLTAVGISTIGFLWRCNTFSPVKNLTFSGTLWIALSLKKTQLSFYFCLRVLFCLRNTDIGNSIS